MNLNEAYNILNSNKESSLEDIKDIYRQLILINHPDKGGKSEIFCKINEAYKIVINNKEKCKIEKPSIKNESTINIFKSFLKTHIQDKLFKDYKDLYLTLEEMYNGKTILINMVEYIDCTKCIKNLCTSCNGYGKIKHNLVILGIKQFIYKECNNCKGFGYLRNCNFCEEGYCEKEKQYTLKIKKGCSIDDQYKLDNNLTIFIIKQYNHPRFIRNDNDLILHKSISLYEAITCRKIKCKHLNRKIYCFYTNKIIQADTIYQLDNLGMPLKKQNNIFGHLYIKFDIILPIQCSLTSEESLFLKKIFDITNSKPEDYSNCIDLNMKFSLENNLDPNLLRLIRIGRN